MNTPVDLKYTKNDEWIKVEGNLGTVGITDYAQDQLSDVVYFEAVVNEGETISQGDTIAIVESVKAASDVYAPASGKVQSVNEELADIPELINNDPYGAAWMVKIELSDPEQLDGLMNADEYQAYCQDREH
jgi:glycine cleavage system H protein